MGTSISYSSVSPVSAEVRRTILSEAESLNRQRDWWSEGFAFFGSGGSDEPLAGDSKVFLPGYSTDDGGYVEVNAFDDIFMACVDTHFILTTLTKWSKSHEVAWEIGFEGPIGRVDGNGPDESVREVFDMLAEQAGFDETDPDAVEERSKAVREQYAARNE